MGCFKRHPQSFEKLTLHSTDLNYLIYLFILAIIKKIYNSCDCTSSTCARHTLLTGPVHYLERISESRLCWVASQHYYVPFCVNINVEQCGKATSSFICDTCLNPVDVIVLEEFIGISPYGGSSDDFALPEVLECAFVADCFDYFPHGFVFHCLFCHQADILAARVVVYVVQAVRVGESRLEHF